MDVSVTDRVINGRPREGSKWSGVARLGFCVIAALLCWIVLLVPIVTILAFVN